MEFIKGQAQEFVALREFGLNWEDRKIKSVKIKSGDVISYDGDVAVYGSGGVQVAGRCPGLKAAINLEWMKLRNGKVKPTAASKEEILKEDNYNDLTGGSFDTVLKKDGINDIGKIKTTSKKPAKEEIPEKNDDYDERTGGNFDNLLKKDGLNNPRVIRDEDRIVGEISAKPGLEKTSRKEKSLEAAPDQVPVRTLGRDRSPTRVTSSTSMAKSQKFAAKLMSSENYGAKGSSAIRVPEKKEAGRKTFTVDASTPSVPEDSTAAEIKRAKMPVTAAEENQEGRVVGTIKDPGESTSVEGVTLRKIPSREKSAAVTVRASESIVDSSETRKVVSKVASKTEIPVKAPKIEPPKGDYLSQLPETWGDMHWVQKEKFIKGITDTKFLEFIMTVETTHAVVEACKKRLAEIEK